MKTRLSSTSGLVQACIYGGSHRIGSGLRLVAALTWVSVAGCGGNTRAHFARRNRERRPRAERRVGARTRARAAEAEAPAREAMASSATPRHAFPMTSWMPPSAVSIRSSPSPTSTCSTERASSCPKVSVPCRHRTRIGWMTRVTTMGAGAHSGLCTCGGKETTSSSLSSLPTDTEPAVQRTKLVPTSSGFGATNVLVCAYTVKHYEDDEIVGYETPSRSPRLRSRRRAGDSRSRVRARIEIDRETVVLTGTPDREQPFFDALDVPQEHLRGLDGGYHPEPGGAVEPPYHFFFNEPVLGEDLSLDDGLGAPGAPRGHRE